jgi:diaminopimelate epimerase
MLSFTKAHAYGNDFLYVRQDVVEGCDLAALARELCDRHEGIGADGLVVYAPTPDGASMRLFNADGSRAEISGNGVRALGALLVRAVAEVGVQVVVTTEAGPKPLTRTTVLGSRQTFRAAMGLPRDLRQARMRVGDEELDLVVMDIGNPQVVLLGPLPDRARFERLGAALEHHPAFPEGTNIEFAHVEAPTSVRMVIWERGVGPTSSSGTGSCAALIAAAAFGGAERAADVIAPGGTQRVEWQDDSVYLTGWAEVLFDGAWYRQIPRTGKAPSI